MTQDMLAKCISSKYMEIGCEGKALKGNSFQFGIVRGNKDEIQFIDQYSGNQVGQMSLTKGLCIEQSQSDSSLVTLSEQGAVVTIKTLRNGERDVLVMFIQYIVKRRTNGELQLKNNQTTNVTAATPSRIQQAPVDQSMSYVQEYGTQPKSAYNLISDNRYESGGPKPQANAYQSQYIDRGNGRPYTQTYSTDITSKQMNSSLYMPESPKYALGMDRPSKPTFAYGHDTSQINILAGLNPENRNSTNVYSASTKGASSSIRDSK